MSRMVTNASDLGEFGELIIDSALTSPDVLDVLLSREEDGEYVFTQSEVPLSQLPKETSS